MNLAMYAELLENLEVRCLLCPHRCVIKDGKSGICRVRVNMGGILVAENYGKLSGIHLDPIEKKPLYHFHPGTQILSVGSVGCNMQCQFCQNCEISQVGVSNFPALTDHSPESVVRLALQATNNIGIAYTYNEPTVFYEFMIDTAQLAKKNGLKNVMVSNGFIELQPLEQLLAYLDACNIDLKAFNNEFYRKYTHSSLDPVLSALKTIRNYNCHLEVTNLVIPGLNDKEQDFKDMVQWISDELGNETVLHLSRYFPRYKMNIASTTPALLKKFHEIATGKLLHVYLGNVYSSTGSDTNCTGCGRRLISRSGYTIQIDGLDGQGRCDFCKTAIVIR